VNPLALPGIARGETDETHERRDGCARYVGFFGGSLGTFYMIISACKHAFIANREKNNIFMLTLIDRTGGRHACPKLRNTVYAKMQAPPPIPHWELARIRL
jgi:hypothetical protein